MSGVCFPEGLGRSTCRASAAEPGINAVGRLCAPSRRRFWLVIREDGHMVTARQEPRLVLISADCENGHLILEAGDMEKISVPVKLPKKNPVLNCRY